MSIDNYNDIINLPRYEPKHPRMKIEVRASQFAPFNALTGYSDSIKEASRLVESKIVLDEEKIELINNKLQELLRNIKSKPQVVITYFVEDKKKIGGRYVSSLNNIKKINMDEKYIMTLTNEKIYFNDIIDIG